MNFMTPEAISQASEAVLKAVRGGRDEDYEPSLARKQLAAELGRRCGGWRYTGTDRKAVQHLFGKRPQWHQRDCMPHADHSGFYAHAGKVMALVEQPYLRHTESPTYWQEIRDWCAERSVVMHTPDFPSWWYPGWTSLILIMLPKTLDAVLEEMPA